MKKSFCYILKANLNMENCTLSYENFYGWVIFLFLMKKSPNFIEIRAEKEPRRFGNPVFYLFLCLREFPFEREWIRWIRTAKNTDPNEKNAQLPFILLRMTAHTAGCGCAMRRSTAATTSSSRSCASACRRSTPRHRSN